MTTSPKTLDSPTLIAKTRRLMKEATPGEWAYEKPVIVARYRNDDGGHCSDDVVRAFTDARQDRADGALIAFYRTAAPELAARLEAARKLVEELRKTLRWYADPDVWRAPMQVEVAGAEEPPTSDAQVDEGERTRTALARGWQ